jgi:hypothetical protein|eukprot:SAG25_NODE_2628_length_1482_cov_1.480839_2_plen_57_part_00
MEAKGRYRRVRHLGSLCCPPLLLAFVSSLIFLVQVFVLLVFSVGEIFVQGSDRNKA